MFNTPLTSSSVEWGPCRRGIEGLRLLQLRGRLGPLLQNRPQLPFGVACGPCHPTRRYRSPLTNKHCTTSSTAGGSVVEGLQVGNVGASCSQTLQVVHPHLEGGILTADKIEVPLLLHISVIPSPWRSSAAFMLSMAFSVFSLFGRLRAGVSGGSQAPSGVLLWVTSCKCMNEFDELPVASR